MQTKKCNLCSRDKEFSEFGRGRDANGLYYVCKQCASLSSQKRYKAKDKLQRWLDTTHSDVKGRAGRKGVAFSLSKEFMHDMFLSQEGKCAYCAALLDLNATRYARRLSPSLDRLVPSFGYTESNLAICCHRCNAIKQDASPEELLTIATAVIAMFNSRGITTTSAEDPFQIA